MLPHKENTTLQSNSLLNVYKKYPVEFVSGNGSKVYDSDGAEYTDFLCGISVTNFGHKHPLITEAVEKQMKNFWHVSNLFESSSQNAIAQSLCDATGLAGAFFSNSGSEAIEAAIKFTRLYNPDKFEIITAIDSFHGRTMGSLSATGQYKLWENFKPILPGFKYVPYGDIEAIENSISANTAALMVEPIQGEGGINIPYPGYLKDLRNLCDKYDILLIIDEIQTGMGRTGKLFCYQYEDITPDIVTSAKAIANGLPLGAVICSEKVADKITPGCHGSTFGGNPIAVAAANCVLNLMNNDLFYQINTLGEYLINSILGLNLDSILTVRGKGLMLGIQFNDSVNSADTAAELLKNKFITCPAKGNVLRLLPPFIISRNEADSLVSAIKKVLMN